MTYAAVGLMTPLALFEDILCKVLNLFYAVMEVPGYCICGKRKTALDREQSIEPSIHSFSSEILPALGARSTNYLRLRKHIISPYDARYRWWQNFLIILVVYSAWVSPFELGFIQNFPRPFLAVDWLVDAAFGTDILLTFFVAYLDKKTYLLVDRYSDIALRSEGTFKSNFVLSFKV